MAHFLKLTIFILAMTQFCSLGFSQQAYRSETVTEWNKQRVTVPRYVDETIFEKETRQTTRQVLVDEIRYRDQTVQQLVPRTAMQETSATNADQANPSTSDTKEGALYYREEQVTVKKPVSEQLVRVQRSIVYKPVLVPNSFLPVAVPASGLQLPARRIQWTPGGYRFDPISGQTNFQRGAFRWNTNPGAPVTTFQNSQRYAPAYTYQPEVVETRTPVTVTRYVDETVTRRVPYRTNPPSSSSPAKKIVVKKEPNTEMVLETVIVKAPYWVQVPKEITETVEVDVPKTVRKRIDESYEKLIPVKVEYRTPIDAAGNPTGATVRVVSPDYDSTSVAPIDSGPAANEATFRTEKKNKSVTESTVSVLKSPMRQNKIDGYPGVLKTKTVSPETETTSLGDSNFTETTSGKTLMEDQGVESPSSNGNDAAVDSLSSQSREVDTKNEKNEPVQDSAIESVLVQPVQNQTQ
jgi:hypothetical protein